MCTARTVRRKGQDLWQRVLRGAQSLVSIALYIVKGPPSTCQGSSFIWEGGVSLVVGTILRSMQAKGRNGGGWGVLLVVGWEGRRERELDKDTMC